MYPYDRSIVKLNDPVAAAAFQGCAALALQSERHQGCPSYGASNACRPPLLSNPSSRLAIFAAAMDVLPRPQCFDAAPWDRKAELPSSENTPEGIQPAKVLFDIFVFYLVAHYLLWLTRLTSKACTEKKMENSGILNHDTILPLRKRRGQITHRRYLFLQIRIRLTDKYACTISAPKPSVFVNVFLNCMIRLGRNYVREK